MRVSLQGFLGQKLETNSEEVNQKRPRLAIKNMVGFSETQDNLRASVQLPVKPLAFYNVVCLAGRACFPSVTEGKINELSFQRHFHNLPMCPLDRGAL